MTEYELGDVLYENPLASESDIRGWRIEGAAAISFPMNRMRMENRRDPEGDQVAHFVHWCPETFPPDIAASWDFLPIREPGLAMFWFAASGRDGRDLFDPDLAPRTGNYPEYHSGDINAYHLSYFRRRYPPERQFHTCNLRKSHGFHLVCQGADPIAPVQDVQSSYRIQTIKCGPNIRFSVNDLVVLAWQDDGQTCGPVLGGGRIGFRQMAPLMADYANLVVREVTPRA